MVKDDYTVGFCIKSLDFKITILRKGMKLSLLIEHDALFQLFNKQLK